MAENIRIIEITSEIEPFTHTDYTTKVHLEQRFLYVFDNLSLYKGIPRGEILFGPRNYPKYRYHRKINSGQSW